MISYLVNKRLLQDLFFLRHILSHPFFYKDLMNNQSEFGRPTFNPYHPLDVNVNYTHDLGSDPKFNGVYNNNVSDILSEDDNKLYVVF